MKKTLSILLSLLMVLSTVTCLFTMPVSAEEAATEAPAEVETLPVNDWITNNGVKTIKPDSVFTSNGVTFPTSFAYNMRGWDQKKDDEGNVISGTEGSRMDQALVHQLTLTVTASEDINEGVKFYPVFHSNNSVNISFSQFVGVRNDVTTPLAVETAYNNVSVTGSSDVSVPTLNGDNAVALVAGKTYTYTYLFKGATKWINHIRMFADGLTAGSVTVSDAKLFPVSETDAGDFLFKNNAVVPYAVEENGNVFTRMYGYRAIGDTAPKKYQVSAALGGKLYNVMFKGGKTYELSFDARYTSELGFHDSDSLGRSPAFDFFETGALDYQDDYNAIRAEGDTTVYKLESGSPATERQREFSGPNNGYSYFYAGEKTLTRSRRITAGNIGTMAYYNPNGSLIANKSQGAGSQHGRTFKNEINTSTWIKGKYTLNAVGAQTLQEAAEAGAKKSTGTNSNMRYTYADGAWTFNSAKNNWYVPAEQDVTVALGLEFLYSGAIYDFDNFAIVADVAEVPVEYKNANGEADTLANTKHTANKYYDALADKTMISVGLFESDTIAFDGWYNGDELVSTDAIAEIAGSYDNLKAVFTSKNILTYAGGFENYANTTSLEAAYTMVDTTNYPNYTGVATDNRRFYNGLPTGDKWTGWDGNVKLSHITDSDNGETKAKIVADIEAAGGVIDTTGWTGFTHFKNFPTVVGATTARTYKDAGNKYVDETAHAVVPYSGTKMLRMQASTRTGYRALEGLTPGTTYTVSFYAYNPYAYYFLKDVAVVEQPRYAMGNADKGVKQLAGYTTPYTLVTEEVHNADGTVASTIKDIQKANADYVGKWYKIELTFKATAEVAYLAVCNQHQGNTSGYTYIDELTLVEYECNGKHNYNSIADTHCTVCGEARVYPTAWDFEDGSMENIVNGTGTIKVVDAADQPAKIGSKYLEYTSNGWTGIALNFPYEQGYKYTISYDFKIFTYGTGATANGIDHYMTKFDDGKCGAGAAGYLAPYNENIVTRYYEDGTPLDKVTCFTHEGGNNFYGRQSKDGSYIDAMATTFGDTAIWNEWQHFEIEVGNTGDYEGLVEFGIRPNDAGWVLGIDNFTVTRVAETTINEADEATDGAYAFNIRARTADKKQGLRFKSTIDLDKLNLEDGAKIVEYGTLAMKKSDAEQGYYLRREGATDKTAKGKVIAGVAYNAEKEIDVRYALDDSTNTLTYTGVLTGIGVKNYDVDFVVCGYAIVETADGQRITVYDEEVTLSVYDAAMQIVEENVNADDVAVAQTVVDTYNAYVNTAK